MVEGIEGQTKPFDFPSDDNSEGKVEATAQAVEPALAFGSAAFPADLPDHIKILLEERIEQLRQIAVEAGFAKPAGDRASDGKTREQREREKNEDALADTVSTINATEREEANLKAWSQSSHTYAGQTLDGHEWLDLMKWFDNPENLSVWEDAMMAATGQTRDEVRQTGGKMKRFYDLMEQDARGTLTDEERREFEELQQDKDIIRGLEVQKEIQATQLNEVSFTARNEATLDGLRNQRIDARGQLNEDDTAPAGALASVTPISPVYREAALGTNLLPLEPLKPTAPVAGNTVKVSLDNMFG
jgi:hypothetical protein